jgi:hypothetical protein
MGCRRAPLCRVWMAQSAPLLSLLLSRAARGMRFCTRDANTVCDAFLVCLSHFYLSLLDSSLIVIKMNAVGPNIALCRTLSYNF